MRLVTLLLLTTGCATKVAPIAPPVVITIPAMSLIGRTGFAHACPAGGVIYTAAHVAEMVTSEGAAVPLSYMWQQGEHEGVTRPFLVSFQRDLAILEVTGEPIYFPLAALPPKEGDPVYWFAFEYDPIHVTKVQGAVNALMAGHVSFSPAPTPGSSGSCIFNAKGEVVGIVAWSYSGGAYGLGPLLAGSPQAQQ